MEDCKAVVNKSPRLNVCFVSTGRLYRINRPNILFDFPSPFSLYAINRRGAEVYCNSYEVVIVKDCYVRGERRLIMKLEVRMCCNKRRRPHARSNLDFLNILTQGNIFRSDENSLYYDITRESVSFICGTKRGGGRERGEELVHSELQADALLCHFIG
jgi:hypothetical protein